MQSNFTHEPMRPGVPRGKTSRRNPRRNNIPIVDYSCTYETKPVPTQTPVEDKPKPTYTILITMLLLAFGCGVFVGWLM